MPMTRYKHAQTGLVTPSPLDRWIDATLCVFAMLVHYVASTFQMIRRREAVNATQPTPTVLPRAKTDTQQQETKAAAQHRSPPALILSSTQSVRPSKDEGVLTHASYKLQQHEHPNHLAPPSLRSSRRKSGPRASRVICVTGLRKQPWIPACAGTSGFLSPPNKNAAA